MKFNDKNTLKYKMNLPYEILYNEIFPYLDIQDLLYFGLVSKKYKKQVDKYLKVLGKKVLHFPKHKDKRQFIARLEIKLEPLQILYQIFYKFATFIYVHQYTDFLYTRMIADLRAKSNIFQKDFEKEVLQIQENLFGKCILKPRVFKFFMDNEPSYLTEMYPNQKILNRFFPGFQSNINIFLQNYLTNLEFENVSDFIKQIDSELNLWLHTLFIH